MNILYGALGGIFYVCMAFLVGIGWYAVYVDRHTVRDYDGLAVVSFFLGLVWPLTLVGLLPWLLCKYLFILVFGRGGDGLEAIGRRWYRFVQKVSRSWR